MKSTPSRGRENWRRCSIGEGRAQAKDLFFGKHKGRIRSNTALLPENSKRVQREVTATSDYSRGRRCFEAVEETKHWHVVE